MYDARDIIFRALDEFSWVVICGSSKLGRVTYGDNYLVRLSNGQVYIASDRDSVVELLVDHANAARAAQA